MAKIDRHQRRVLHEVFPYLIAAPIGSAASKLDWLLRSRTDGWTPGEREYLEQQIKTLKEVHSNLMKIYYRLKH